MQKSLLLARLTGTQAQMGAQHGRLAAGDAARLLAFYRTMPERSLAGGGDRASRFVVRQIAAAWQARLARERPAEFTARTTAFVDAVLAEAPGMPARDARRAFAVMDSMQNCVSLAARAQLGPFKNPVAARVAASAIPACSTVIAWGGATEDGELLFGRNFDFPGVGVWDAAPAFVTCVPDRGQRYGFFTTRGADTAVVTVVNEAGLVMAPHTRWHRGVTWGGAMIVDLVHEIARRAETLADAIAIARETPASSSWGLAIGSAREKSALVLELAGRAVEVVRPHPGAESVVCTN
ncbi:MAG TPA: carcinine hydrolase/isopenicillin-N N-acyltransferase family protein, partial [Kofleriaceae bacterium]